MNMSEQLRDWGASTDSFDGHAVRNSAADLLDECELVLSQCYSLILREFSDARAQALEGEIVSKEARPEWYAISDLLGKMRENR